MAMSEISADGFTSINIDYGNLLQGMNISLTAIYEGKKHPRNTKTDDVRNGAFRSLTLHSILLWRSLSSDWGDVTALIARAMSVDGTTSLYL